MYRHSQRFGVVPSALIVLVLAVLAVFTLVAPLLIVAFIPVAWVAWTFSQLTVTVGTDAVEWAFRGGFWRKRLRFADIVEAKPVRNRWWYGWGVHLTPNGWLYNVGGLHAVELRTKAGRRLRIGSDEPDLLAAEIDKRLRRS